MGRKAKWPPSIYRHKDGRAFFRWRGRNVYVGRHGTVEADELYTRRIAEIRAAGGHLPPRSVGQALTVRSLAARWVLFARDEYLDRDGQPSGEQREFGYALEPVLHLYRDLPAADFDSLKLKAVRAMIAGGWTTRAGKPRRPLSRGVINQRIGRIVHIWKWAAGELLVPTAVYSNLALVDGIRSGRRIQGRPVHDYPPVPPVAEEVFQATLPYCQRPLQALALLQRYTGMRPGEVCRMRPMDVDRGGIEIEGVRIWLYTPGSHRPHGDHKGAEREERKAVIPLGPRAQEVLAPFLLRSAESYCFSPAEAMLEYQAARRAARKTPVQPSQQHRAKKHPKRAPSDCYTPGGYAHALGRAIRRGNRDRATAGLPPIPHWHPHQIRHTVGTEAELASDLDTARARLRHLDPKTTVRYSAAQLLKAAAAAAKVG